MNRRIRRVARSALLGAAWTVACTTAWAAGPEAARPAADDLAAVAACVDDEAPAPPLAPDLAAICTELRAAASAIGAADPAAVTRHLDRAEALLGSLAAGVAPGTEVPAVGSRLHAQLSIARSWVERQARRLDAAEVHLARAERLLDRIGLAVSTEGASILNQRTMLAFARQDLPATVEHARAEIAMSIALGLGGTPDLLDAYATLGAVLSMLQRFDEADAELRAALEIMDRYPDANPSAQMGVLNNLASGASNRGRYAEAIEPATRAIELARRVWGADTPRQVTARLNRSSAWLWTGRLGSARDDIEAAARIEQRDPGRLPVHERLNLHNTAAGLHRSLGDPAAAREAVERGLALAGADPGLGYWRGRLLALRAMLDARERRHADAVRDLAEAVALIGSLVGPNENLVRWAHAESCVQQSIAGLATTSCDRLREGLPTLDAQHPYNRYVVHAALAVEAQRRDDVATEREQLLAALAAAEHHPSPQRLWPAPLELARHLWRHGHRPLAIVFGKQSIDAIQTLRADLGPSSVQPFVLDKAEVFREVADWLAEEGRIDETLFILRLLKEQEFHDFTLRDASLSAGVTGTGFTPRERAALLRWRDAVSSTAPPAAPPPATPPAGAAPPGHAPTPRESPGSPRTPFGVDWARSTGQALLEALARDTSRARPADPATLAAPRSAAEPGERPPIGELHVHALAAEGHLTLVLVAQQSRRVMRVPWDRREAARQVGQALAAVGDPARHADVRAMLQPLSSTLGVPIAEAAEAVDARRLVLHLDGALRYLPIAALHDGRRALGERYAIEHRLETGPGPGEPGAAVVAAAAMKSALQVRALGVSRAVAGQRGLPGVAREVCTIVDGPVHGLDPEDATAFAASPGAAIPAPCVRPSLRATVAVRAPGAGPTTGPTIGLASDASGEPPARGNGVLAGEAWLNHHFTTERLKRVLAEPASPRQRSILHVGSHFTLRPGDMQRSWLLLGDGGKLQLRDMAELRFDAHDLVALSACETGMGGAEDAADGREVEGFARLVARRGAGAVLATLWRVDDASTSRLMRAFYRELSRTDGAEALRRAQAEVRNAPGGQWSAPFHWAGFVLLRR